MKTIRLKDEPTLLAILAILLAIAALWAVGCGSGGGGTSYPTEPLPPNNGGGGTAATTVNIVGTAGSSAFTPNPVPAASGSTLGWKNDTSVTHHIVMDNGTVVGDVAPGATVMMTVSGSGGNYHCTTHPTMVGSINGAAAPPEPTPNPTGGYDY